MDLSRKSRRDELECAVEAAGGQESGAVEDEVRDKEGLRMLLSGGCISADKRFADEVIAMYPSVAKGTNEEERGEAALTKFYDAQGTEAGVTIKKRTTWKR